MHRLPLSCGPALLPEYGRLLVAGCGVWAAWAGCNRTGAPGWLRPSPVRWWSRWPGRTPSDDVGDRAPGGGPWPACCPAGTGCSCAAPTPVGPGGGQRLADRITAIAGRAAVYEQLCGGRPAGAVRAAPRPVAGADVGPGHRRGTGFAGPRPGEVTHGAWLLNGGKSRVGMKIPGRRLPMLAVPLWRMTPQARPDSAARRRAWRPGGHPGHHPRRLRETGQSRAVERYPLPRPGSPARSQPSPPPEAGDSLPWGRAEVLPAGRCARSLARAGSRYD